MVPARRPGLHHRVGLYGATDGAWDRVPVLRAVAQKVGSLAHMGGHDVLQRHHLPVVLLGLLPGLQQNRHERLHRRSPPLRPP